jgi:hypothetical protein
LHAHNLCSLTRTPSDGFRGHSGFEVETDLLTGDLGVVWESAQTTDDFSTIRGLVIHISQREMIPLSAPRPCSSSSS